MLPLPLALVVALATADFQAAAQNGTRPPSPVSGQAASRKAEPHEAAALREEALQSAALGRSMNYRVLLPEGYEGSLRRYPVLYLLHGLNGDYQDWTTRANLAEHVRGLPLIVVMPDGENSWYTNSAGEPPARFESYILDDLVKDVETKFRATRSRYGRAIAGLSMGGYGALKLSLRRPGTFAVVGSFSGAVGVARDEGVEKAVGDTERQRIITIFGASGSKTRADNDVFALAAAVKAPATPYFYLDCGTGDGLLDSNRELVTVMKKSGLAYEYHEVPGAHTWEYWNRNVRPFLAVAMEKLGGK